MEFREQVEAIRREANLGISDGGRAKWGQFFTPKPVAALMASMFGDPSDPASILDAGAGSGSLFATLVAELASRSHKPSRIRVEAFEIDPSLLPFLKETVACCKEYCAERGVHFEAQIFCEDFLHHQEAASFLQVRQPRFHCVILNPPYGKIRSNSHTRHALRRLGIEATNLYAGFLAAAVPLILPNGELVAITPRSFCNGPYFRGFRTSLLREMALQRIHVFESRDSAFEEDGVLQENIIFHAVRSKIRPEVVRVSVSHDAACAAGEDRQVSYSEVVHPNDPDCFIHLPSGSGDAVSRWIQERPCTLSDLSLCVSTGRVVDFRARDLLRAEPSPDCAPLIYPSHFGRLGIEWPKKGRKPNAIRECEQATDLLVPNANYVLVKRFSAKEEKRRIAARVYEASQFSCGAVGFENHLNYFHEHGRGLPLDLAWGLAEYLNSPQVDQYFRVFSGHTQVNATDLRRLRYPTRDELMNLGRAARGELAKARLAGPPEGFQHAAVLS